MKSAPFCQSKMPGLGYHLMCLPLVTFQIRNTTAQQIIPIINCETII